MKIMQPLLPLFLAVVLSNGLNAQRSMLKASPLQGTWIEAERKADTIVFSPEYDGQNAVFDLKRGTRTTEEGFTLPDYFSGPYSFKPGQNSISVYWFLSSGSSQTYYFNLMAGENKFEIGNFFKDPEKRKPEKDTLLFIRIK